MDSRASAFWVRLKANRLAYTLTILATLTVGILIGTVVSSGVKGKEGQSVKSSDATPLTVPAPQQLSNAFSQIAKQLEPSVVNISTESTIKNPHRRRARPGQGQGPGDEDNPFEDFFDKFFGGQGGPGSDGGSIRERSLGSGVLVDTQGCILTKRHVVEKAYRIRVRFQDDPPGVQHEAKVIGTDQETDLAVIKVDSNKGLPAAKLGNSDSMQIGDWVLAFGSPFGQSGTVTAGIVSYKGRNIVPNRQFQSFIQTDAAINPGNSGGPLVDMQGEVIGINTAIVAGGSGIGFAIPSNMARKIYSEINSKGRVTRGWLGVSIQPLTQELARSLNDQDTKGVLISDVVPESPAAKAGLKSGDILIEFDGKKVEAPADLQRTVGLAQPGHDAKMKVWRDQGEKTVDIKIGEAPDEKEVRQQPSGRATPSTLGLDVRPLTPEIARQLSLKSSDGVIVARVDEGSAAGEAGVQRGAVIREINRQKVRSMADYERLTKDVKEGDRLTVLLQRGQMSLYVAFTATARG